MAEFASAIVALAATGAKAGDTLYSLIDTLKDAPNEFLALSNEMSDFRVMLSKVIEAKHSGAFTFDQNGLDRQVERTISRGKEIVQEIEKLVQKVSKSSDAGNEGSQVDRMKWLRQIKKAKKLQASLRVQKSSISQFLTLEMLKSSLRNGIRVAGLQMRMDAVNENQISMMEKQEAITTQLAASQELLKHSIGPRRDSHVEYGSRVIQSKQNPSKTFSESGPAHPVRGKISFARIYPEDSQVHSPRLEASLQVTRTAPLRCLDECSCRCHYRSIIRSPRYLSDYLGDFFLGCSNLPWHFSGYLQCNEQTCRRSRSAAAELRYFLPPWFDCTIASFSVSFSLRALPLNVCLQTRHTIPYDSPILICAQEGDIKGMRKLLRSGVASLNDVDPYGLGLLYYATYYCWRGSGGETAMEACRFLLDLGAHADWEDEIGNTPMETMVDDTLVSLAMEQRSSHGRDLTHFQHIAQLFGRSTPDLIQDFLDDRGFTSVHEILLGITSDHRTLDEYLASFGQATLPADFIDAPDARGRTALAWAAEYGLADAVKTLLRYGSNPHQLRPSVRGKSPLLHLVIAGPTWQHSNAGFMDVVNQLLEAGVDVNAVDHEGWTPLHVAASWNNYDVVKELATCAASELHWDSLTDDKQSATELSLGAGFDARVIRLLQNHASSEDHLMKMEGEVDYDCSDNGSIVSDATSSIKDDMGDLEEQFFDAVDIS